MDRDWLDDQDWGLLPSLPKSAPVQSTEWLRPESAWPDKDRKGQWVIYWKGRGPLVRATAGIDRILNDFMALKNAEPQAVARFIEELGPLGLCSHGLPRTHLPRRMWNELAHLDAAPCEVNRARPYGEIGEPVERWHHFAGQAFALHQAARLLMAGERLPPETLRALSDFAPSALFAEVEGLETKARSRWTPADEQRFVTYALQGWLNYGDVGMHPSWKDGQGRLRYGGNGLAGALALQLALTCTGTESFFTCNGCSIPYLPTRKPRANEHHYCPTCQERGVPNKDRQQRFRAKQRRQEP